VGLVVKTAIKPNYFRDFRELSTLTTEKKADEDIHLHKLAETAGWGILTRFIDDLKEDLDKLIKARMESGATFEEIGQKSIMVAICKEYLTKIQNKVYDAHEAIEENEDEIEQQPGGVAE
jgi:hypothetical protein